MSCFFFPVALRPNAGHGLFILEVFLDHTQRRTTVGRTSLDEWSARRRDLYLTTQNTHNRQTSMPPGGFEPTISAGECRELVIYNTRYEPYVVLDAFQRVKRRIVGCNAWLNCELQNVDLWNMSTGKDFVSESRQIISNARFLQRNILLVFVSLNLCHGLSHSLLRWINECVSPVQKHYRICISFYCYNLFLAGSDLKVLCGY